VDEDAPCFLQLTSGTTGQPKAWVKTYRSWAAVINHNLHHFDTFGPGVPPVGEDDVNLHFHPIQWASGFQTLYPYFLRGARSVLLDDEAFDPDLLLDTITSEAITGVFMPGPLLTPVLDAVERRGGLEHRLRRMVVFFGTAELLERTTQLLGPVWAHGFGSTEQGAITTRLLPSEVGERRERLQSVGRPGAPFFEVAIFDDNGKRLGPGQIGEIAVRSAMSIGEYWALPDKTREAFFPGDWFRPYDVGYLDEDGFLYYADRAGDKITAAGGVVFPHLVETAVLRHEAVANCGVVGLGEPGEQQVVAAVILKATAPGPPDWSRRSWPARPTWPDTSSPPELCSWTSCPRYSAAPRSSGRRSGSSWPPSHDDRRGRLPGRPARRRGAGAAGRGGRALPHRPGAGGSGAGARPGAG
jgi:acyl-coenzyme A synthetase/AMP-(fatty) acid ligase